jgi:hypothetical protein
MPSISHRRRDKHMIRGKGTILPAGGNKYRRQVGHLRLVASETHQASGQPGDRQIAPEWEGATITAKVTHETFMPKRQHQGNRKYKIDERSPTRVPQPKPLATPIVKREFMLTPEADDTLFQAVRVLSRATGTNLSNSHFLRVMLKVVAEAMPQIEEEASRLGKLKRPGNAPGNQPEREEYEQRMAGAVAVAIAASTPADGK